MKIRYTDAFGLGTVPGTQQYTETCCIFVLQLQSVDGRTTTKVTLGGPEGWTSLLLHAPTLHLWGYLMSLHFQASEQRRTRSSNEEGGPRYLGDVEAGANMPGWARAAAGLLWRDASRQVHCADSPAQAPEGLTGGGWRRTAALQRGKL